MYGFIDDIVTIAVDDEHWIYRAKSATLLVIHTLFRQLQPSEPLKQDDPRSLRKLVGEGQLAKQKNIPRVGHKHSLYESITTNR